MNEFELDDTISDETRERIDELIQEYGLENVFDLIIDKVPKSILENILSELEEEI